MFDFFPHCILILYSFAFHVCVCFIHIYIYIILHFKVMDTGSLTLPIVSG